MRCVCVYVCMYVCMYKRLGPVPISLSLLNRCCRMDLCRCLTQLILRGRRKPFGLLRPLYGALTALTLLSVIVSVELPALPRAEQREHDHVRLWYRKCVQTPAVRVMSSMHTRNKDSQARLSRPNLLDSKGNEREQSSRTHLELVQARVSEAAYDQLQHDLAVIVRRLLDSRLPRNGQPVDPQPGKVHRHCPTVTGTLCATHAAPSVPVHAAAATVPESARVHAGASNAGFWRRLQRLFATDVPQAAEGSSDGSGAKGIYRPISPDREIWERIWTRTSLCLQLDGGSGCLEQASSTDAHPWWTRGPRGRVQSRDFHFHSERAALVPSPGV